MKEYYEKIRENVPNIEELDDEIVEEDFFQNKLSLYAQTQPAEKQDLGQLKISQRFI